MILKHYFDFGQSNEKMDGEINWEYLRDDELNPAFMLEQSREDWINNCEKSLISATHAKYICDKIAPMKKNGGVRICSLGVGKALVECNIKVLSPDIYLCCTDYTANSIVKLGEMFTECEECRVFDMLGDSRQYEFLKSFDIVLMYRISTEFDKATWRDIFKKISGSGVRDIIFIPTELAGLKDVARETYMRIKFLVRGEKPVFTGWLYSEKEFMDIFSECYYINDRMRFENTAIYSLHCKEG